MPADNWRHYLVLSLAAILSALWLSAPLMSLIPALGYDAGTYADETTRDLARQNITVQAQVWMAWGAWTQVAISAAGLVGLALTAIYAHRAWREQQLANRLAHDQFVAERRPWLVPELSIVPSFPSRSGDIPLEGAAIAVTVSAKNIGQSPAVDVYLMEPRVSEISDEGGFALAERLAEEMSHWASQTGSGPLVIRGGTLFPNQALSENYYAGLGNLIPDNSPRFPVLMGYVAYRFSVPGEWHFSPYAFELFWPPAEGSTSTSVDKIQLKLPMYGNLATT